MTRPDTRRALMRHALYIPPWEKVRVTFIVLGQGEVQAVFECLTCGTMLVWNEESRYWECPDCEYELTVKEAQVLHVVMADALDVLCPIERSWLWALVNWLRTRLGRWKKNPLLT